MRNVAREIAGVYPRVSKDRRGDAASVTEQRDIGLADCEEHDWEPRLYDGDNDRSASKYAKQGRTDWPRLLDDIAAGQITIVWLWESSRGDRKLTDWSAFLDLCEETGTRIYVHTHGQLYDCRNGRQWKTMAEDGVANAYASYETSLRVKRDLDTAAARGRPHGSAPYGLVRIYDTRTKQYVTQEPAPPASEIAAEIIGRIARAEPLSVIRADLHHRGIPSPHGGRWGQKQLRMMGLNPGYAGRRRAPDGQLVKGWAEIVPLDIHLAAKAVLEGTGHAPRPGRQRYLLSYLALCECGEQLQGQAESRQYRHPRRYLCRCGHLTVPADWADERITDLVCAALAEPDAAELYRADSTEADRHRAVAEQLRAELDEWAAGDISARAYAIKEAKLLPRIEAADRAAQAAGIPLVLAELLEAEDVRAAWEDLDIPARRAVIRAMMTITVTRPADRTRAARTDPERIKIGWVHGPGATGTAYPPTAL